MPYALWTSGRPPAAEDVDVTNMVLLKSSNEESMNNDFLAYACVLEP